jgi:hypothetical protein
VFKQRNEAALRVLEACHRKWSESLGVPEFKDIKIAPVLLKELSESCGIVIFNSVVDLSDNLENLLVD